MLACSERERVERVERVEGRMVVGIEMEEKLRKERGKFREVERVVVGKRT